MSRNRSLDEFGSVHPDDRADARSSETTEASDDDPDEDDPAADVDVSAAVVSTYQWSPAGAPCAVCGESVEERWRDGDDLVCVGCKEW